MMEVGITTPTEDPLRPWAEVSQRIGEPGLVPFDRLTLYVFVGDKDPRTRSEVSDFFVQTTK